ncbi:hypothetical protein FNV43_RR10707 [Rhamnella rubrinervis]|uniref:Receptor-like serine/threonine-protein kinase n=1 Tax=Rhamnella rubrinervis TaxID=2594499 RepID=A0A8K0H486_9ROSA|nr:hypothetical protein FNV43_RR10707 [Rhamnella rubrinervis]
MTALSLYVEIFTTTKAQQRTGAVINLGSSLYPNSNSHWVSNSSQFAFGFYKQGNGFAIGIWLETIKQKTVVWTANRDDPPLPQDVSLLLSLDGRLILQDREGLRTPICNSTMPASYASMLDSGNFVLYDDDSMILCQSFDSPTDTLLPGQSLSDGKELVSAESETNHASGRFRLRMQRDGNLVQYPVAVVPPIEKQSEYAYWASRTFGDNVTLTLDHNGQFYLINQTGRVKNFTTNTYVSPKILYRLTLDVDGLFRLYYHSLVQNQSWSVEWSSSNKKCDPLGLCGLNAYCIPINEDPPCRCIPGFDFIDKNQKNLGCKRNFSVDCTSEIDYQNTYSIEEMNGMRIESDPYSVFESRNKSACIEDCLRDCNCGAALFRDQKCMKQRLPLRFAREVGGPAITLVKVGNSRMVQRGGDDDDQVRTRIFISSIAVSSIAVLILALGGVLSYRYRVWEYRRIVSHQGIDYGLLEDFSVRPYTYDELDKATNGFRDQVGEGAFGTVFKGVLTSNGNMKIVAVKRLQEVVADQGEREFRNEMRVIGRTQHKNLVKLLGYCHEGAHRLLIYEFMTNGSLADCLFDSETKPTWEERIRITTNIARGLLYLHEECETQIIHCDVKPENILMDDQKCAKIADFGLSKLLMPNQSRTYTGLRGTRGYVAPEWHKNTAITVKADVYSFGIVLLEVICCRRSVDMEVPEAEVVLSNWVYDCFELGEVDKLVKDHGDEVDKEKLEKIVKVGLWCIQDEPSLRPSMNKVVLMLEGTLEIPDPPSPSSSVSSV